ncbi:DUF4179 domain-containing protein [Paenibacillus sp. YPG26]|uniref:DUF4179 domain-containing protein n=1 Tax=Paenibacillus sp. YPG26 TaxID=2878915 RepID=UPI00203BF588|nr:DUF4179 domain-containing protein [Paenibacillus sp. YPG26]USB33119.1 DUF4179 domain-containing protein [Paenibacillus sp. YPG26]
MDRSKLEQELKELKPDEVAISPLVRLRLDETYASLPEQTMKQNRRRPSSPLRRTTRAAAAAGILGAALFASGFVSPVMADSLRQIPVIGSIFSSIKGDTGLRNAGDTGLAKTVNSHVSHKDVKLEVTETVFDGSRAAFLVNVTAPNLDNGQYDNGRDIVKLSSAVDNVFVTVDGKRQGDPGSILKGTFYSGAGEAHPNMLIFEQVLDTTGASSTPDSFQAQVALTLDGIDHEFKLEIPFHKTASHMAKLHPNVSAANDELTVTVKDLQATPVTTRLTTSIALNQVKDLTLQDEDRLRHIGIAVVDDQGRRLTALNGEGEYQANQLNFDSLYASAPETHNSKYLIVKPFVIKDDFSEDVQEDQYIRELEVKIELPQS